MIEIEFQIVLGFRTFNLYIKNFFLYFYVFSFFFPFYIKNFFILPSPIFYRAFTRLDCCMVLWNRANDYRLELWFTWSFFTNFYTIINLYDWHLRILDGNMFISADLQKSFLSSILYFWNDKTFNVYYQLEEGRFQFW